MPAYSDDHYQELTLEFSPFARHQTLSLRAHSSHSPIPSLPQAFYQYVFPLYWGLMALLNLLAAEYEWTTVFSMRITGP